MKKAGETESWWDRVRRGYRLWTSAYVSDTNTEDGYTPPIVLGAWALRQTSVLRRPENLYKRFAAAADPKTPQWVFGWLLRGHPQKHSDGTRIMSDDSFHLFESMSANPALSPALVERLVLLVQKLPPSGGVERQLQQTIENLCRHPQLSAHRRRDLVQHGATAAGLEMVLNRSGDTSDVMRNIGQEGKEIGLASSHLSLSAAEIEHLSRRWIQAHAAYRILVSHLKTSGFQGQPKKVLRRENAETEESLGASAALIVTHPQMREGCRELLIAELNRGDDSMCVWEYSLKKAIRVEEQVPCVDYRLFEARVEGLRGQPHAALGEELAPWIDALRDIKNRAHLPKDLNDAIVVRSAMQRSPATANIVALSEELRARMEWTPDTVRQCLMSSVKAVRLFGLHGVAEMKSGEELRAAEGLKGIEASAVAPTTGDDKKRVLNIQSASRSGTSHREGPSMT